jgi:hypothetical protein
VNKSVDSLLYPVTSHTIVCSLPYYDSKFLDGASVHLMALIPRVTMNQVGWCTLEHTGPHQSGPERLTSQCAATLGPSPMASVLQHSALLPWPVCCSTRPFSHGLCYSPHSLPPFHQVVVNLTWSLAVLKHLDANVLGAAVNWLTVRGEGPGPRLGSHRRHGNESKVGKLDGQVWMAGCRWSGVGTA